MSLRGLLQALAIQTRSRPVLISDELAAQMFIRDAEGNRLNVFWGQPDLDGFYTLTVSKDENDNIVKAAKAEANNLLCVRLREWAEAAKVTSPRITALPVHTGQEPMYALTVSKSDLLGRIIFAGERPSQTKCPVHLGVWSGCHGPWPTWESRSAKGVEKVYALEDCEPMLQGWYNAGCRCWSHRGSSCTTGWQPDPACGCLAFGSVP